MHLSLPISYVSVGRMRNIFNQISSMDAMLMGYWVSGQPRTMRISVMYKSKLRMWDMTLRILLVIPSEMFLRYHLRSTRGIDLLGSVRNRVDLRDEAL